MARTLATFFTIILLITAAATATELLVPADYATIQAAYDAAGHGDTITVAEGVYTGEENRHIEIGNRAVLIRSVEGPVTTIIDCEGEDFAFLITAGLDTTLKVSGFTIRNSVNTGAGGVFRVLGSSLLVENCVFVDNLSPYGGVVYANGDDAPPSPSVIFRQCTFVGNSAQYEGSISYCQYGGMTVIYENCLGYGNLNVSVFGGDVEAYCTNLYGNQAGNWVGSFGSLGQTNGNISADPEFCFADLSELTVLPSSPCLPNNNSCGVLMGASSVCSEYYPFVYGLTVAPQDRDHLLPDTFSVHWTYVDDRGFPDAYELEFGTDPDWAVAELWTSGVVTATANSAQYGGPPLARGDTAYYRLRASNGSAWSDWGHNYVRVNELPGVPSPLFPVGQEFVRPSLVRLRVTNAPVSDADPVTYTFEVFSDPGLSNEVFQIENVTEQDETTSVEVPPLDPDAEYWWRCRTFDGFEYSDWSAVESFQVLDFNTTLRVPSQYATIKEAVASSLENDTVLVADGVYAGPGVRNIEIAGKNIIITSENGPGSTIIDLEGQGDAFRIRPGLTNAMRISGFTFRDGSGGPAGGVLKIYGSSPLITDCVFMDNVANLGGAVYCNGDNGATNPLFRYCTFANNRGFYGSGDAIFGQYGGLVVTLENCILADHPTTLNEPIVTLNGGYLDVSCTNVFGNDGGNWLGQLAQFAGISGNLEVDPDFCPKGDIPYFVVPSSPMLIPTDACLQPIGALGVCADPPMATAFSLGSDYLQRVVSNPPTFYWTYLGDGEPQVMYEMEVGTDDDWTVAEQWASGQVLSSDTAVVCGGPSLVGGQEYWVRIRVFDGSDWGIWREFDFRMNRTPTRPFAVTPADGATLRAIGIELAAAGSDDGDNDPITYEFVVCADEALTDTVVSIAGLPTQAGVARWQYVPALEPDHKYWWAARAFDGYAYSPWSETFELNVVGSQLLHVPADFPTLHDAFQASEVGDTVLLADGVYTGDGFRQLSMPGWPLILMSENGPATTIIDLENATYGLRIPPGSDSSLVVRGITFRRGSGGGAGGALRVYGSAPLITECIFTDCVAAYGGAMYLNGNGGPAGVTPIIRNSVIAYNRSSESRSAAIYAQYNSIGVLVQNCILFANNNSRSGTDALILNTDGPVTISCSNIFGNLGGDWTGQIASQATINGNLTVDPAFCEPELRDFHVSKLSPMLPEGNSCNVLMGALLSACEARPVVSDFVVKEEDPTHVLDSMPEFAWSYWDARGLEQDSIEFQLATDSLWDGDELWAFPATASADTALSYGGPGLGDGVTYYVRLRAHNGDRWSSWTQFEFHTNGLPPVPVLLTPADSTISYQYRPFFQIERVGDPDGDPIFYEFQILALDTIIAADTVTSIDLIFNGWQPTVFLRDNRGYQWRVRVTDLFETTDWSPARDIFIDINPEPPRPFSCVSPSATTTPYILDSLPIFTWTTSFDPDPIDIIDYDLTVATDPDFTFTRSVLDIRDTTHQWTEALDWGFRYYWKVVARDNDGNHLPVSEIATFVVGPPTCCENLTGNVNGDDQDLVTLSDLTELVNSLFVTFGPIGCKAEANVDGDEHCQVSLSDLTLLVNYLFVSFESPAACGSFVCPDPEKTPVVTGKQGPAVSTDQAAEHAGGSSR